MIIITVWWADEKKSERGRERWRGERTTQNNDDGERESDTERRETTRFDTLAYIIVGKKRALRR